MTDLVTGAGGFAGRALVEHLVELGRDVVAWARFPDEGLEGLLGADRVHAFDLVEPGVLERELAELAPKRVFHLAAIASPRDAARAPDAARAVNVEVTRRLVRGAPAGSRFLLASTAAVYAPKATPIEETDPLDPRGAYACSKAEAERAVLAERQRGVHVLVARAFNHSGPGQSGDYALPSFARRLARAAVDGGEIPVGDLDVVRDFMHVRDTVRAYATIADRAESGAIVNVCSGVGVTMRRLFEGLARRLAPDAVQRAVVDPALVSPDQPRSVVGCPKRLEILPFAPEFDLEELLDGVAGDCCAKPR
ncbi:MAG: NAD-dependent epimerase/dehydratase family protein [Planctomycetota bacterium]